MAERMPTTPEDERMKSTKEDVQDQASLEREALKEGMDTPRFTRSYKLGSFENPDVEELNKIKKGVNIIAGVDATKFDEEKQRSPDFYNKWESAAQGLKNCYKLLDASTKNWFDSLEEVINDFIDLGKFDEYDSSYSTEENQGKLADWVKIVEKYGKDKIYGKKGLLNLGLAWLRACDIHNPLKKANTSEFDSNNDADIDELGLAKEGKIVLKLGDKVKEEDQRFATKELMMEKDVIHFEVPG